MTFKNNIISLLFGLLLNLVFVIPYSQAQVDEVLAEAESSSLVAEVPVEIEEPVQTYDDIMAELPNVKRKQISLILDKLIALDGKKTLPVLTNLLQGNLYYQKSDKTLFAAEKMEDGQYQLSDLFSNENQNIVAKSSIKKIKTNNKLRKQVRAYIAKLELFSTDTEVRLSAVENLMQNMNDESSELLKKAQLTESNKRIKEKIQNALALSDLSSGDPSRRLSALTTLNGSLEPAVKNKLVEMTAQDDSGEYSEKQPEVLMAAQKTLKGIDSKITVYGYIERIFFGLSLGSILLLVAAGLAITFGVMGVINMAHGELIMIGAYTTYVMQLLMPNHIGLSIFLSIPAAFMVSALFGIAIERGVIQFLKGRPLETLLATFGISLVLQQLVRTVFSPLNRQVVTPEFMSGSLEINSVLSLTYNRIYILIFSLLVFAVLLYILKKTPLGLYVRAVSQNRNMAKAMGIRSEWVDAMTFGLGSGIAGLAGVALSQVTNVGPNLGQAYIIDSFMVVVFGGVGNLWGTLVGAFALGSLNKFLEPAAGAVLANIIVLVGIILFIQKKPRGLFPQKGRAAE